MAVGRRTASRGTKAGVADYRKPGPTAENFVQKCLAEENDEYEMGGAAVPGTPSNQTREWDCSGLVYTKLQELGIDSPRSSTEQLAWCEENNTIISLERGIQTRGALLLRKKKTGETYGHVAVSLGDGRTIEALGEDWGVGIFSATSNRTFSHAALVPGLIYGKTRVPPAQTGPATPARPPGRPTLRRGSRGSDVEFLQQTLEEFGYDPGPIDGIFGSRTERAVKDFQTAKRLLVDGIVGKQTWGALT